VVKGRAELALTENQI